MTFYALAGYIIGATAMQARVPAALAAAISKEGLE